MGIVALVIIILVIVARIATRELNAYSYARDQEIEKRNKLFLQLETRAKEQAPNENPEPVEEMSDEELCDRILEYNNPNAGRHAPPRARFSEPRLVGHEDDGLYMAGSMFPYFHDLVCAPEQSVTVPENGTIEEEYCTEGGEFEAEPEDYDFIPPEFCGGMDDK